MGLVCLIINCELEVVAVLRPVPSITSTGSVTTGTVSLTLSLRFDTVGAGATYLVRHPELVSGSHLHKKTTLSEMPKCIRHDKRHDIAPNVSVSGRNDVFI
jgi:hypothetical protein